MKRYVFIFSAILIIVIIGMFFYRFPSNFLTSIEKSIPNPSLSPESSADVIFPVQTSSAFKGNLIKSVQANGILRAKREVEIVARVGGEITRVAISNGEYVHVGENLLKIDDREYGLAYERASNMLLGAQIDYKTFSASSAILEIDSSLIKKTIAVSKSKLSKLEEDFRNKKLAIEDYMRLKRDYETELAYATVHRGDVMASKSGLSQARESYERAKLDFEATTITAPFEGFVANCDLAEGMRIQAGRNLFTLIDISSLLVDVEVLETEVGKVRIGTKAEVTVNAFQNEKFVGSVVSVNPIVDIKSKTIKVTIELKNGKPNKWKGLKLRPGMFAAVKLETEILLNRLLVPKEALLTRDQRNLVFIVESNLAKWCYVKIGEENEQYIEIKDGIKAGDAIIVKGHYTLAHHAKVKIEN